MPRLSQQQPSLPTWPAGMTKAMAAAYIGKSSRELERALAGGSITARRDGRRLVFLRADLDEYLAALPKAKPGDVSRPGHQ